MKPTEDELVVALLGEDEDAARALIMAADDTTLMLASATALAQMRDQRDRAIAQLHGCRGPLRFLDGEGQEYEVLSYGATFKAAPTTGDRIVVDVSSADLARFGAHWDGRSLVAASTPEGDS